jgi:hypothetical protein
VDLLVRFSIFKQNNPNEDEMKVKIYRPTKNAMQSGKANIKKWVLEFCQGDTRFIEPIMGWTGNTDTNAQVKLKFPSEEDAVAYAKRNNLDYIIMEPHNPKIKIQAYSDNFI